MDRTGIIVVSLCVVLLGVWFVEQNKIAQQQSRFAATNSVAQAQNQIPVASSNEIISTNNNFVAAATATATTVIFDTNSPEQIITLTNGSPHHEWVRYTFTSRGGGLKQIELLGYPETISARWKKQKSAATNGVATLNARVSVPALAVAGDASLMGDGNFTLTRTADGVRAEKNFTDGLSLVKNFRVDSNYLVSATIIFSNRADKAFALPAQEIVVGTATPMDADDSGVNEGVMWSDGVTARDTPLAWFSGAGFGCVRGAPRTEFRAGATNVVWAAAHNQFFTLLAMTQTNDPAREVVARPVTLPAFTNVEQQTGAPLPQGIMTALVYPAMLLPTNSFFERQITLFAGPKEYRTLADIGAEFQNRADDVMGFNGFFGFCAKPLLLAMNWLHDVTKLGYGWVIVLITVLIKVIFWPLTSISIRSSKKMQILAPELKVIQEKYKGDAAKFMQKRQELFKKHNVSMLSGCFPMLIQTPVFIGFFTMLRTAIELRGAHFLWVADLSKPDTLFLIPGVTFIPIISTPDGLPFNLLPLLMGAAMLWQSHMQPPAPGMDPAQQKMMRWLPGIFILFLYNYSAGLALYWTVNNLLTVLQTKVIKNLHDPVAPTSVLTPVSKKKK
jgi:YidC/Oxa1 family membrane protein insertase